MLPPSKSEYDQDDVDENDLEAQMRAAQSDATDPSDELSATPGEDDLALDPDTDTDTDVGLDPDEDLGQEEVKPKKKGMGKGTIVAAVGAGLLVVLCGAAYMMQGQLQAPAPSTSKIAIDPSLMDSTPAASSPIEPTVSAQMAPLPASEITPNLNAPTVVSPTLPASSSVSAISAPPSDPFGGSTSAPSVSVTPPDTSMPTAVAPMPMPTPVAPVAPPASAVAITPAPSVDGPRGDPFGSMVTEKPAPRVEKPTIIEQASPPVVESAVKTEKRVRTPKARAVAIDNNDDEVTVKPRAVKKRVRKPSVIRQDMTVSEPHPSQERLRPQSSESFHGYEKLF